MGRLRIHPSPVCPGTCVLALVVLLACAGIEPVCAAEEAVTATAPVAATPEEAGSAPDRSNSGTVLLSAPVDASSRPDDRLVPFDVTINGVSSGTWLFIERDEQLYATRDAFENWRLTPDPEAGTIVFREETFYPLTAIEGFEKTVDFNNQSLELAFSPEVFAATRLSRYEASKAVLNPVLPSLFLNYDFNYSLSRQSDGHTPQDLSTLAEIGWSTGLGVLTSSFIGSNLTNNSGLEKSRSFNRLETTFTKDFPTRNLTLRLGDAYTKPGMLGRSIYFGGISFGTNFGLTPGYIRQPLQTITGLSATPSTVELYINDVLRQVSTVPTGPFAIDNFPSLSGNGRARVVVRDQLGRETVVEQSFLSNSQLLAKGVNDWSIEAGSVRNELETTASDYRPEFISGILRRGIRDALTVEARAEVGAEAFNFSLGGVAELPLLMLGRAAMSNSQHQILGSGRQWLLGVEYQSLRNSFVFEVQGASANYRQLGQDLEIKPVKRQFVGSWSYGNAKLGAFSLGMARVDRYDAPSVTTMTASYSRRIGKQSNLSLIASRAKSKNGSTSSLTLNFVMPLGTDRSANTFVSTRNGQRDVYQTVTKNPGLDSNLGWRALAGQQMGQTRAEAGAYYAGRYGSVNSDLSHTGEQTSLRLGAASSLVFVDGSLFATKRLDDSFAVAEIEGYGDIGVGIGSNVVTHTNRKGKALIPRLMPYQNNAIQLDPRELPISAAIDSIEELAVPSYRSAVKISFPVRSGRGALLRLVLDDGDVAPMGALVNIQGETEQFYVARRGEAFVTGLQDMNRLILNWQGQSCVFEVRLPLEVSEDIPRVGPMLCTGVTR